MNKAVIIGCMLIFFNVTAGIAFGDDKDEETQEPVYAIQEKIFYKYHEVNLSLGYLTNDDFYEVFPIGIGYVYNFSETWAWDLRLQYAYTMEKDLKEDLETNFGVTPSYFKEPKYLFQTHVYYKILYGKDAFLNRTVINHETYLFAGLANINYEDNFSFGSDSSSSAMGLSLGFGKKIFLTDSLSLNLEIQDIMTFNEGVENNICFGLSFGYRFNTTKRKTEKKDTVDKLQEILQ